MRKKVAVIGALGHVGFPFCLSLAEQGHEVYGIDNNQDAIQKLHATMKVPYKENRAQELFDKHFIKNVHFYSGYYGNILYDCDAIFIMIGTPSDEEGNARVEHLFDLIEFDIIPRINRDKKTLIALRSTVIPGTTDKIKDIFERNGFIEGEDYSLVFAPERVSQGNAIEEESLPQLIGAYSASATIDSCDYFLNIVSLTPKEAEYAKLFTNMYRYVNFALANEFYMLTRDQDVNINKIIRFANHGYPRMNLAQPGPAAGACLAKDGKFLTQDMPFTGIVDTAYKINEGLPAFLLNRLLTKKPDTKQVLIYGMAFKAESDDIRLSLSFKLKKLCEQKDITVRCFDPYVEGYHTYPNVLELAHTDAVFFMTPHKEYVDYVKDIWNPYHHFQCIEKLIIVDPWGIVPKDGGIEVI